MSEVITLSHGSGGEKSEALMTICIILFEAKVPLTLL